MVPSNAYPVEVEAIKKIFLSVQYKLPQAPVTASAITLQLPGNVEKEVVAKVGINKLKLFHICGTIILREPLLIPSVLLCSQRVWTSS
jgi:hypothetical protein